jgi:hypothetical protein
VAIQPVTYRPITPVEPIKRREGSERAATAEGAGKKRAKLARKPDKGQGENLDMWV